MKKILLLLSIFVFIGFFCIGCKKTQSEVPQDTETESNQQAGDSSEDLVIRPGIGVGKIKFGMTVQQMKDILGKPDVAATGISYMHTSLGIEVVARDEVVSHIYCGNPSGNTLPIVKAMETTCKFKTVEGIGIGSTEDQVLKAFGQPTKRSNGTLRYKDESMSISLANDKVIGIVLMK